MLVGDAAGQVSPLTGGGIRLAFHHGRRAGQAIADHILDLGPPLEAVLAHEMPRLGVKTLLRRALDLAPPNALIDAALGTSPMRWLAAHVYFHRRSSAHGIAFADFEQRLAQRSSQEPGRRAPAAHL